MLSTKDITIVYETLLLSPGMNETVKVVLNMPRRNILLLSKIIELGLATSGQTAEQSIMGVATKEIVNELSALCGELLNKAGLQEMNNKLSVLNTKQL